MGDVERALLILTQGLVPAAADDELQSSTLIARVGLLGRDLADSVLLEVEAHISVVKIILQVVLISQFRLVLLVARHRSDLPEEI